MTTGSPTFRSLPAEERILYASAWPTPPKAYVAGLIEKGLDWSMLIGLANRERALPLVWHLINSLDIELPEEARGLQNVSMVNEFRMYHLEQQIQSAIRILSEAGIDTLLLKGAALALKHYGSFDRRPMIDADVLVPRGDAHRAWALLRDQGWIWRSNEVLERFYESHHHLPPLLEPTGTGTAIEIHVGLRKAEAPFVQPLDDLWQRSRSVDLDGSRTRVPHGIDLLIHLSTHFAWSNQMASGGFRTFRDAAVIAGCEEIDWDDFVEAAQSVRATTCCYWTFRLANSLLDAQVPESLLRRLSPPGSSGRLSRLERSYALSLFPHGRSNCPSVRLKRMLWTAGISPEWSGHGAARPWVSPDPIGEAIASEHPVTSRYRNPWQEVSRWRHYLAAMLGGSD
jgi:hypothetical protein